jgi:altronate hydrolase
MTIGTERAQGMPLAAASNRSPAVVRVAGDDNVAVTLRPVAAGEHLSVDGVSVTSRGEIGPGHKVALESIRAGDVVVKFGVPIGVATEAISAGDWVHSHNLRTALSGVVDYVYSPSLAPSNRPAPVTMPTFKGHRRPNGKVGTRNELWVLNTVGCVNHAAERIARQAGERFAGEIDGVHAFAHPYGCSQLGDDLSHTQRVLAGLMRHPNAGGVLILGLGCENNQLDALLRLAGDVDRSRLAFFNTQDVIDELEEGTGAVAKLVERMSADRRVDCPASDLVLGHKCGGSDGFSGISANPLLGRIADRLTSLGGGVILTEVPEMFGAEQLLMNRAENELVFNDIVAMINDFKSYFIRHGQPIYENPSPGNKAGGLTTLEEKSLGAIQKGGRGTISRVLRYGDPLPPIASGVSLLESPGNDAVSSTAMVVSGATLLLFTTGRGTPLGFPVPTIKVSSNGDIAQRKPHWIDFDAGRLLGGATSAAQLEDELFAFVLDVASGSRLAKNESNDYREIAIWKDGVTL